VASQRLNPGVFQFNNLDYYGGLRNTEIVIRDAYGGRQVLSRSVYFTDQLLRAGLQDYSYNFGVERENVGTRSSDYSGAAYSLFHRYGWSDALTVGARSDGNREAFSAGPLAAVRLGDYGVLGASFSLRRNTELDQSGEAWVARHSFESRYWSTRAQARWQDRAYSVSAIDPTSLALPHRDTLIGAGYNSDSRGNLSYDVTRSSLYDGTFRNAKTLGYSLTLRGSLQLFASVSRVQQDSGNGWEGFAGASISFEGNRNASLTRQKIIGSGNIDTAEYAKSAPEGEGHGYRVALVRTDEGSVLEPFGQLNTRYWIFTADGSARTSGDPAGADRFGASMAGAIVFAGGHAALTRPVQSSFVLAKVGELEGVRVYRNNQEAGRTDERGVLVVPTVTSYAYNSISIEPQDVPMGYEIPALEQTVVPPLGSGVLASFKLRAIRAYEGKLLAPVPRGEVAAEHVMVRLRKGDLVLRFTTGYGGEFYLDGIEPGTYEGAFGLPDRTCEFHLNLPAANTTLTRLQPVIALCEPLSPR
jgi:outer membrane usher protein FimD/PapC